jgi:tetratricopeptide (TPR) repeat protein
MGNLAACYWSLRQLDKSVPLFEELLPLSEKRHGRWHPHTLMAVGNLGVNYKDAERVAEAIPLLEEAYRAAKTPPTLRWVGPPLLDAYVKGGKPAEAVKLIEEVVADVRRSQPKDSPQLAQQLAQYSLTLLEIKGFTEAEPLLRKCLAIRVKAQPDAWTTFNTQSMLGGALLGQQRYAEAEPLLLAGYEGMKAREKTIPPQGATRIPDALDRLIELYTVTNKPDEAMKWRAERAKYPTVAPPPREKK